MVEGIPPGDALPPSPQRATPTRKGARSGAGAGSPRPHRPHQGHTGRGAPAARSRGRAASRGTAPDTRRPLPTWQATPPGDGPPPPPGTQPPEGMQTKGTVLGPHTHTPAPTACGWRTPTARPVGGQSGEGQRLTSDPLTMVEGNPPRDALPPTHQRATPARKGARCGAFAGSPRPDRPHLGHTGRGTSAARSRGRAAGGGTAPDTRRPSQRWHATPPGTASHHPRGTQPPQSMQGKGTVLGPHTHTPAPTARGWRTPTARPVGGQSGEGQRLTSDAPHNGERHPPRGRRSATPTASNAGPQGRTLWGRCWVPTPAPTAPRTTRVAEPWLPAPKDGRPGEGQRLTPDAPRNGGRPPPRGRPPTTPAARSPHRACRPRGHCWAPTPTRPRPQHVGGGPQQPAQWAGSRGRDTA